MRIVFLSDTHNQLHHIKVPDGDLLVHCGDATNLGTIKEVSQFYYDLTQLPHKHKVVIAGNHDFLYERQPALARSMVPPGVTYLQDEQIVIEGFIIYGSPFTLEFCEWAFNMDRHDGTPAEKWAQIPDKVDILVTHGPPKGILDRLFYQRLGDQDLMDRVMKIRPKIHAFGHIHYSYGEKMFDGIHFVNAASCGEQYRPDNPPIVVDL